METQPTNSQSTFKPPQPGVPTRLLLHVTFPSSAAAYPSLLSTLSSVLTTQSVYTLGVVLNPQPPMQSLARAEMLLRLVYSHCGEVAERSAGVTVMFEQLYSRDGALELLGQGAGREVVREVKIVVEDPEKVTGEVVKEGSSAKSVLNEIEGRVLLRERI